VRVGPLSTGALVADWPPGRDYGGSRPGERTVSGTLLAADDRAPTRWLEAADVIVVTGEAGSAGPTEWLRRYPGSAVAAALVQPGECSVATRDGLLRVEVSGQGTDNANALACAVFVHGWLAVGWPLALFRPARLHISHDAAAGPDHSPLFFRFSYRPVSGDDPRPELSGPDSASRTA
jgi:hypothetical protein